jgi:pimeloyl-ACP methyl ester carboxylesterase
MKRIILLTSLNLMLSACGGDGDATASQPPPTRSGFVAEFNPNEGKLPFPNNLLFSGSADGTLNIPVADPANLEDPRVALNALDGFSTVTPIIANFTSTLNPATVTAGNSVRVFIVELVNPFLNSFDQVPFTVQSVRGELTPNVDYSVTLSPLDPNQTTVVIIPLRPLQPKTSYLVVLTDAIRGVDGFAPLPDLTYIFTRGQRPLVDESGHSLFERLSDSQAQALEPIRRMVVSQEEVAATQGIARGSIVVSWTFTTQSTTDVLAAVRQGALPQTAHLSATGLSTADLGLSLPGITNIYAGTLEVPYYLDQQAPLTGHWRGNGGNELTQYNPTPMTTESITIPLLITVPNAGSGHTKPETAWPCAIFQHGLTQNRTDLLAIADTLAAAGLIGIAIDLPLHGITHKNSPFYDASHERTFNLDLVNNTTLQPPADGLIDPSGSYFINLTSLLTSRDNLRQGAADLLQLTATLPTLDIDGDATPDCNAKRLSFVGHSLGGIVGGIYLGLASEVTAATLAMAGGGIAKLLDGSPSFGPLIAAGLAAKGLLKGTPEYEAFMGAAQTVLDSGDPINYAGVAAAMHPIHLIEVVGGAGSLADQTVPNRVAGAPLSGTEPLARIMKLRSISTTTLDSTGIRGIVRFTAGTHSSILSPTSSPAATVEMQSEVASFMATAGTSLTINNPDVIQQIK